MGEEECKTHGLMLLLLPSWGQGRGGVYVLVHKAKAPPPPATGLAKSQDWRRGGERKSAPRERESFKMNSENDFCVLGADATDKSSCTAFDVAIMY